LTGEEVLVDAAGVASTPDDICVANRGGSCTADFLAVDGEAVVVVFFESGEVSVLLSMASAMNELPLRIDG